MGLLYVALDVMAVVASLVSRALSVYRVVLIPFFPSLSQPVCMYVCVYIYIYKYMCILLSVYLSVCLSVYLTV